jgi:hypothetical protein
VVSYWKDGFAGCVHSELTPTEAKHIRDRSLHLVRVTVVLGATTTPVGGKRPATVAQVS